MAATTLAWEDYARRLHPREEDIRGPYFRDQTAIIHATPFRRLKHKTQAFFAPENDHTCTRMEHVLHVATIAATICRGLNAAGWDLEPDIAYTAGLGHDLGHAPFGHAGETALSRLLPGRVFRHEAHSLRVVNALARDGKGLNLTQAVRDGIACHNGERFEDVLCPGDPRLPEEKPPRESPPATWEGCAVRFADKVAYLGRDLEDALSMGLIAAADVPKDIRTMLGSDNGAIINTLVLDLIGHTASTGAMGFSAEKTMLATHLYAFNTERIYRHPRLQQYEGFCHRVIEALYAYIRAHLECPDDNTHGDIPLNESFRSYLEKMEQFYCAAGWDAHQIVTDYIAGMTDNFALDAMEQLSLPPFVFR